MVAQNRKKCYYKTKINLMKSSEIWIIITYILLGYNVSKYQVLL